MTTSLLNKTVVVFGGSSGIGLATARLALARGARVAIAARSYDRLAETANCLEGDVILESLDAQDSNSVELFLDRIGNVDHIFTTVGGGKYDPQLTRPHADQEYALNSRFWSAVNIAKCAEKRLQPGGSVTFTSGIAAWKPIAGEAIGAASCAGVEVLARSLSVEMKPIRFNAVVPGPIDTPMLRGVLGENADETIEHFKEMLPVGRIGKPEDVAHAVLFLMENSYVAGTALIVDGGFKLV